MSSILKVSEIQEPTNGNTAISADSTGRVTTPNMPGFLCRGNTSAWKRPGATGWYTFVGGTTVTDAASSSFSDRSTIGMNLTTSGDAYGAFNTGGHFNASTSVFTAPVNAAYFFHIQMYAQKMTTTNADFVHVCPLINGAIVGYTIDGRGIDTQVERTFRSTYIAYLSSGDTFQWAIYNQNYAFQFYGDHIRMMGYMIG